MKASPRAAPVHDYARELTIEASAEVLFGAIATLEGVRGWWTPLATGSAEPGGTIRLEFEGLDEHIELRVVASRRPTSVQWAIVAHTSLDEWNGTRVCFEVSPMGTKSNLAFRHVGLSAKLACYEQCEAGWDHFLGSLVAFAERGQGSPFRSGRSRR